mgnify:FL=1|tara:strand:+ start:449 stop:676 length:228 start_codon:yes stop_codon:yes gene_type:complete
MIKQCKIGDLVILKDYYSYHGIHTKRNIAEPTVGLIIKENSPDMCVHWLDELITWEREENLIIISGVEIIGKKKS